MYIHKKFSYSLKYKVILLQGDGADPKIYGTCLKIIFRRKESNVIIRLRKTIIV